MKRPIIDNPEDKKLLNKTFYQFVFSFISVVAAVLVLVLVLGSQIGQ